jgi:hypothetical protein
MLGILDPNAYVNLIACLPNRVNLTDELRDELGRRGVSASTLFDARGTPRFHCCGDGIATLTESPLAIRTSPEQAVVIIRDISRTGIGLLSHQQWFPDQIFHLLLPETELVARVRRARYICPNCFEIGLSTQRYRDVVEA